RRVGWVGGGQVDGEAEALEILPQVLQVRVAVVESSVGGELCQKQRSQRCPDSRYNDAGAFGIEITAEPLEVRTKQEHIPAQVLLNQIGLRRCARQGCSALDVDLG